MTCYSRTLLDLFYKKKSIPWTSNGAHGQESQKNATDLQAARLQSKTAFDG
jgi:hypothetical protein